MPGARISDYVPRLLILRDGARALVHVRFKGGDLSQPFVQWVACDRPFADARDLARRAKEARGAYPSLKPRAVRIWIRSGAACRSGEPGHRWLAGSLAELRRRPEPGLPSGFSVERCPAQDIHRSYVREYRKYLRAHPEASAWIRVESLDSLRQCALFALKADGRARGLVALRRQATPWFDGWCVVESHLFEGFRGRGLAAPMHRAAYDQLPARRGDQVWGTIAPGNARSLATAKRVGRVEIGGEWWVG